MPLYEYECPACGVFEVMQKISEQSLSACPQCQAAGQQNSVKKLVSCSAFHLKGSGWYKTDYTSGSSSSNSSSKSSSTSTTATESSSAGGESKDSLKTVAPKACGSGCGCH